ncbi:hypothetical protein DFH09DRAFT_1373624, partial [Mycena vulgaris]
HLSTTLLSFPPLRRALPSALGTLLLFSWPSNELYRSRQPSASHESLSYACSPNLSSVIIKDFLHLTSSKPFISLSARNRVCSESIIPLCRFAEL